MIDRNPFRIEVTMISGAIVRFTTSNLLTNVNATNGLTRVAYPNSRPKVMHLDLDQVSAITSHRRFPWGLFE